MVAREAVDVGAAAVTGVAATTDTERDRTEWVVMDKAITWE